MTRPDPTRHAGTYKNADPTRPDPRPTLTRLYVQTAEFISIKPRHDLRNSLRPVFQLDFVGNGSIYI